MMVPEINEEYCKGCGYCMLICPKKVLEHSGRLNAKGYDVVEVKHPEDCIHCKKCELICPEFAINVIVPEQSSEGTQIEE
ncbi:MAG: 4Fe-4S dicluster domain-containing protein [Candidatus Helarchaeales archaeon]